MQDVYVLRFFISYTYFNMKVTKSNEIKKQLVRNEISTIYEYKHAHTFTNICDNMDVYGWVHLCLRVIINIYIYAYVYKNVYAV